MKKEKYLSRIFLKNLKRSLAMLITLAILMLMLVPSAHLDILKLNVVNKISSSALEGELTSLTPVIKKLSTQNAKLEGGQKVIVTGKNFSSDTQIFLGSNKVDSTVKSETKLEFRVSTQKVSGALTLSILNKNGIAQCRFNIIPKDLSELKNGEITTLLGGELYFGDGLLASSDRVLINPFDVTVDNKGNIFFPDALNHRVRRVDTLTGLITTIAGTGVSGFSGDGSLAITAKLNFPSKVIVDNNGNVFISDSGNNRVRKIDTNNVITTVAGNGNGSNTPENNVPATSTPVINPRGLALDSKGNLFIVSGNLVSKVDFLTQIITTIAGSADSLGFVGDGGLASQALLSSPSQILIDKQNNLIVSDSGNGRVRKIDSTTNIITSIVGSFANSQDDGVDASSAQLIYPEGIALDNEGNLFIAEAFGGKVRRIDAFTNTITTIAGNGKNEFSGDGGLAINASLKRPIGVCIDKDGDLLIADFFSKRIRKVDLKTNIINTITGNEQINFLDPGEPFSSVSLLSPSGLAIDTSNNLFFSDKSSRVGKLDIKTKNVSVVAGTGFSEFDGDGKIATKTSFSSSTKLALDKQNELFIIDRGNNRVRKVDTSSGIVKTVAGNGFNSFSADNIDATSSRLGLPFGIAVDDLGNLFIADTFNDRIRKVDVSTKFISTVAGTGLATFNGDEMLAVAASLNRPTSVAVDTKGNLFIADSSNNRIRKVAANGIITTFVGGGQSSDIGIGSLATRVRLSRPQSIAIDSNGDVFFSDSGNNRICKVDFATGIITSVIGSGELGLDGDGALAKDAKLNLPEEISIDNDGNLFFVDSLNNRIRVAKGVALGRVPKPLIPIITNVKYEDPVLTISGSGFGDSGAIVLINQTDLSSRIGKQSTDAVFLLGDKQKLKLRKGKNKIIVKTNLGVSNIFIFSLS